MEDHFCAEYNITRTNKVFKVCSIHLFIESLTKALESRDPYTAGHSDRIAEEMSLKKKNLI